MAEFGLTLDAASRIVGINDADYDYDSTGQLTGATYEDQQPDESYQYDENGNRTNYVIGANNQILSDGTYNYTYDNEGNRTSRTNIITNETTTYEWDNRNRLISVTTNKLTVNYAYDYLNRLVSRTVIQNGQQISKENFIHDGDQIVLEFSNNQLAQRNLWGVAVDELLATDYLLDDDTLWALANHQNSITNILQNNNGQVIDIAEIDYDAFGNIVEGHNPLHYGYTGKYHDNITNLQWNINRWYDSTTGQWISEDPISFGGGDANLYRYVGNAAINFVDVFGLKEWNSPFLAGTCAFASTLGNTIYNTAYDFGNTLEFGKFDPERYNKRFDEHTERLYNVSKNLGYTGESRIGTHAGVAQALAGDVAGTNAIAEAISGYGLGTNTLLDPWERAERAAQGTAQVAGTLAVTLNVTGVNPSLNVSKSFLIDETKGLSVLGRYPRYIELADELNAKRFNIPRRIADTMTSEELWSANQKFLDRVITRGDNVRLSVNTSSKAAKESSYLAREIAYLLQHGYEISPDGWWLIKK